MPTIQTVARPIRSRVSVPVPKEYNGCSFEVFLVPIELPPKKKESFVDALLSCPRFDDNDGLDIERDHADFGREIAL